MTAANFRLGLERWFQDEVEDRIVLAVQKIGMEALGRLVKKSPVKSGRFKGNWLVAIGAPASGTVDSLDPSGAATVAAGKTVIDGLTEAQAIYLCNNLPYASRLEAGSSIQAPGGVVAVTLAELEAFFGRVE